MTARTRRAFVLAATFWLAAALLWTMTVLALGLSPRAQGSWLIKTFGDKIIHAGAFTVGGFLWMRTAVALWRRHPWAGIVTGTVITIAIGVALEVFQRYVPGRQSDALDLVADIVGTLPVVVVLLWWEARRRLPQSAADSLE